MPAITVATLVLVTTIVLGVRRCSQSKKLSNPDRDVHNLEQSSADGHTSQSVFVDDYDYPAIPLRQYKTSAKAVTIPAALRMYSVHRDSISCEACPAYETKDSERCSPYTPQASITCEMCPAYIERVTVCESRLAS